MYILFKIAAATTIFTCHREEGLHIFTILNNNIIFYHNYAQFTRQEAEKDEFKMSQ